MSWGSTENIQSPSRTDPRTEATISILNFVMVTKLFSDERSMTGLQSRHFLHKEELAVKTGPWLLHELHSSLLEHLVVLLLEDECTDCSRSG